MSHYRRAAKLLPAFCSAAIVVACATALLAVCPNQSDTGNVNCPFGANVGDTGNACAGREEGKCNGSEVTQKYSNRWDVKTYVAGPPVENAFALGHRADVVGQLTCYIASNCEWTLQGTCIKLAAENPVKKDYYTSPNCE